MFYERKDFTSHFFRQAIFLPAQKIIDGYAVPHSVNIKVNCMIHEILKNKSVVLASASPRRAQLFSLLGLKAEIYPADIAEPLTADPPDLQAITHARNKAAFTAERYGQQTLVVAADTVVAIAGQVLGKPRDDAQAREYLQLLSGCQHSVFTGICLRWRAEELYACERTEVCFDELSRDDIQAYLATGEPFDKAGAYGIQGYGAQFITRVEGCYFNVMGFPVSLFYRLLKQLIGETS